MKFLSGVLPDFLYKNLFNNRENRTMASVELA